MSATTVLLAAFSPLLVALVRRCTWPREAVEVLALVVVAPLYVLGQWLDGALTWPPLRSFWAGLAAAWGVQQAAYKALWRDSDVVRTLELWEPGVST